MARSTKRKARELEESDAEQSKPQKRVSKRETNDLPLPSDESEADEEEDKGRQESVQMLANMAGKSKWLFDLRDQVAHDEEKLLADIEETEEAASTKQAAFQAHIRTFVAKRTSTQVGILKAQTADLRSVSSKLLDNYRKTERVFGADGTIKPLGVGWSKDKQDTINILTIGKRISEKEEDAVDQDAKARALMSQDGPDSVAAVWFGGQSGGHGVSEVDGTLKYMEKGVRKIARGLPESDT